MTERMLARIPGPRSRKAALRDAPRAALVMPAVLAAAEKETGDPQVAMFTVVLVLVEDTVGALGLDLPEVRQLTRTANHQNQATADRRDGY
jgi:hypothetical protein